MDGIDVALIETEWIASPSVSISATSMPSIEVPLISPIAFMNPRLTQNANAVHGAVSATRSSFICRGAGMTEDLMHAAGKNQLDFIQVLRERGYMHQISDEEGLKAAAAKGIITAYAGYDCTAPSLHVGNLISIMMLRVFQRAGHKPIVLVGGGTTKVGDPSGKDETRKLLTQKDIDANKASIKTAFTKLLSFGDSETDAILVDNDEWLKNLRYIKFLREYGRHFTINRMLTFDLVKLRLEREQPLTFLEFNYMLLQAYDYLELARRYNCVLQMGGSDQWGNIVNGIELGRRIDERAAVRPDHAADHHRVRRQDGQDRPAGAVWLNADVLQPYDYWQFWRNTEDADVGRFLRLFTDLPLGRDRAAGSAGRRRDQRGQEGAGNRGDRAPARACSSRGSGRDRAPGFRGGRLRRKACRQSSSIWPME